MNGIVDKVEDLIFEELTEREKAIVNMAVKRSVRQAGRKLHQELRQQSKFSLNFNGILVEYEVRSGDLVTFSETKLRELGVIA
jgi:hypothetical protein